MFGPKRTQPVLEDHLKPLVQVLLLPLLPLLLLLLPLILILLTEGPPQAAGACRGQRNGAGDGAGAHLQVSLQGGKVLQCAAVHDVQAVRGVLALIRTVQKYSCISTSVAVQHAAEVAVYQWQYISTAVTIQQQLTQHCCTAAALQLYIPHQ